MATSSLALRVATSGDPRCTQASCSRMLASSNRCGFSPAWRMRVLEERLVRARGAACHHHAVQPVLEDRRRDLLLRVLRAGVQVVFGVDHARQGPGVLDHVGHVDHAADVDPAVADEHADARLLVRSRPAPAGTPSRCVRVPRASASSAEACAAAQLASMTVSGMSLGSLKAPATKMPGREVCGGLECRRLGKAELVQAHAQATRPVPVAASAGLQPDREHHQVEFLFV